MTEMGVVEAEILLLVFEEGLSVFGEELSVFEVKVWAVLVFEEGLSVWAVSVCKEESLVFEEGLLVFEVRVSVLKAVQGVSGGRGEEGEGAGGNVANQAGKLFTWRGRGAGGGGLLNFGWRRRMGKMVLSSLRARKV